MLLKISQIFSNFHKKMVILTTRTTWIDIGRYWRKQTSIHLSSGIRAILPDKSPTLDILGTLACNQKPVSPAPPCVKQRYGERACGAVLVFHVALVG